MTAIRMANKLRLTPEAVADRLKKKGLYVSTYDYDYDDEVFLEICHEKYSLIKGKKVK